MTTRTVKFLWMAGVILGTGCAQWSTPPSGELGGLPLPALAPDSVVLELVFVRVPRDDESFDERFWTEVDEQVFPAELRQRMAANGFRCGVLGTPPPTALQEVLDQQPPVDTVNGEVVTSPGTEVVARTRRLRSRAGHAGKVIVDDSPATRLAALTRDAEGVVRGHSLDQAQSYLSVVSRPQGDGQVRIELTPIIEHGQPRSRFVGQQGAWSIDNTSRSTESFEDLKIEATLAPGQMVAVSCTMPPRGLGEQFFSGDSDTGVPRLLLLVRLQQTQLDDRFNEEGIIEPVAAVSD
ncbi:MAG: hypothetical protein FJ276_03125 [Planctomycetes bacterium]|nr:hypothetical protein [Planctomycetota bacterium]